MIRRYQLFKTILVCIITSVSLNISLCQEDIRDINSFKYLYVYDVFYDQGQKNRMGLKSYLSELMESSKNIAARELVDLPRHEHLLNYLCVNINHYPMNNLYGVAELDFSNIVGSNIHALRKEYKFNSYKKNFGLNDAIKSMWEDFAKSYAYDGTTIEIVELNKLHKSENEIKEYLDNNVVDNIEGVYKMEQSSLKLTHLYSKETFYTVLKSKFHEGFDLYEPELTKQIFKEYNSYTQYLVKSYKQDILRGNTKCSISLTESGFIEECKGGTRVYRKVYPSTVKVESTNSEWKASGSGFFISTDGLIVTNHHVVENMNDFEIQFKQDGKKFFLKAEVVQVDKTNDLAILKIIDNEFDELESIPYNLKTKSSKVGVNVFALGYPLINAMGEEIKFTDGKISSKTGFQGDITTYQISVPIQPGNSGGPLFDYDGNLVGIVSSGIRRDVAENVSYAIKSSYLMNLVDVLPNEINLPSDISLASAPLTDKIEKLSEYTVLIKVR